MVIEELIQELISKIEKLVSAIFILSSRYSPRPCCDSLAAAFVINLLSKDSHSF